jgi:hypothetical protein
MATLALMFTKAYEATIIIAVIALVVTAMILSLDLRFHMPDGAH